MAGIREELEKAGGKGSLSIIKEVRITEAKNGYIVQYSWDVPIYLKIYRSWPEAMEAVSRFFALGNDEKPVSPPSHKKGDQIE